MLPLLLVQLTYKSIWLLAMALPLCRAGALDAGVAGMTTEFLIGAALDVVVIP